MTEYYVLKNREVHTVASLEEWAKQFELADRHVAQDEIGGARISTIFLGINHNHSGGPPLLFETIIFGGAHNEYQDRCSTWAQAEAMHTKAMELVKRAMQ